LKQKDFIVRSVIIIGKQPINQVSLILVPNAPARKCTGLQATEDMQKKPEKK